MSWSDLGTIVLNILRWAMAVVSVAATLGLFAWILKMILKKEKRDELH
jgi:hypothetical protein